jgi:hypothetical protein
MKTKTRIQQQIIETLQDLNQYRPIDNLLIEELVFHKQQTEILKAQLQDEMLPIDDRMKLDTLYNRHDRNFRAIIDSLNLSPYYRSKLDTIEEAVEENPFDTIKELMNDD